MEPQHSHLGPQRGPSPLPLSTATVSNFLYSFFRNPDLTTSPASLLADDSTSYFVGKIELTREKFPRSPATNLQTSLHSRCSSQTTRHLAQADVRVCLPPVKPLTAAWSSLLQGLALFILLYLCFHLTSLAPLTPLLCSFCSPLKQSQNISVAPGTAGGGGAPRLRVLGKKKVEMSATERHKFPVTQLLTLS